MNPNNPAYQSSRQGSGNSKAALDNRSNQLNPNHAPTKSKEMTRLGGSSFSLSGAGSEVRFLPEQFVTIRVSGPSYLGWSITVPIPSFTSCYAVVEQPDRILVLFGVKTAAEYSHLLVHARCRRDVPNVDWSNLESHTTTAAAPEGLQYCVVERNGDDFFMGPDEFTSVQSANGQYPVVMARPLRDVDSLLSPPRE